ncbi:UrcA family protein [Lichenicola cladoniae]|uniref:UrcA family protein n=1 Tax=Lichenicola cladoniae TaxID=1484109 RepID=A0A6M8HRH8_9PROT|nr:UrcA family protein [Lichenicola cladoniae]NPD65945.1 UrcA family protein [Acetobacteraceae bacterium]QKE91064.1 UrcA family protein [Lichenicola cladoniae]
MTVHSRSFNLRAALSTMLAVSVLSCAAARGADPDVDTHSVSVDLSGIDVFSPTGRAAAKDRIAIAASSACGGPDFKDLSTSIQFDRCREEAMSTAQNDLDLKIAAMNRADSSASTIASR